MPANPMWSVGTTDSNAKEPQKVIDFVVTLVLAATTIAFTVRVPLQYSLNADTRTDNLGLRL